MSLRIEDYALIGDTQTAALVGRDGSVDWWCAPRFDSGACFAALLGKEQHGRWLIAPKGAIVRPVSRRYRPGTLILETEFATNEGRVRVIDYMPIRGRWPDIVRIVEGLEGSVPMQLELVVRFDYGSIVPWVRQRGTLLQAVAGPDALVLRCDVPLRGHDLTTVAEFTVAKGDRVPFALTWHPSNEPPPPAVPPFKALSETEAWWTAWSRQSACKGPWADQIRESLVVLKALTFAPTGGIIAAPTTSLPEKIGGVRNWDYRFCWLRDATFTLYSLMLSGHHAEAGAWRDWLLRSVAGDASKLQIMYGVAGERRLPELELDWLPGYADSKPVRSGNAAVHQLQLDVYGEVMDALYQARRSGLPLEDSAWTLQRTLVDFLESGWRRPDSGLWEVRGTPQDFTHSKVMAWVAFDRAVRSIEETGVDGPIDQWRKLRAAIHAEVCERAFDRQRNTFTQAYGSSALDASALLMPIVGFLPASDPRVHGTVRAIEQGLLHEGYVRRYTAKKATDGLPPGEGAFLACSFWLADNYALMGRTADATQLFERLLALRNDVGLLSEEYDPTERRLLGNFPQAFSHVGLINTAYNLTDELPSPARHRRGG
jgi:GH15 family glucan-1,4-alpha-glucosidase